MYILFQMSSLGLYLEHKKVAQEMYRMGLSKK